MLDFVLYLGCLIFGHMYTHICETTDGTQKYKVCGLCGKQKKINT